MMRVLIVDDEPFARSELKSLLATSDDIEIIGECANAIEAIAAIHRQNPDVVFLDIQMPRISGLEMLAMLDPAQIPHIVFLTAYDEYAVQAFEEHAFDYLLKPADPQRLEKTLQRLRRTQQPRPLDALTDAAPLSFIPCYGVNRIYLMKLDEVEYVASRASGVGVFGSDQVERVTELTLRTLEEKTPLLRCHRQYLVNLALVREIRLSENGLADIITRSEQTVPVSRRYLKPLKEKLGIPG
ncbi:two-component system response regulator BtsR [Paludibacterium yongneupense]|uniref:two-component system response regulator BtsR n=1 Tax=Paludibacterium yongneupense TaxID=400061 RepID=UPI000404A334|nr:two-component system response regulator BtsR [Paludibacterium yongneupense]